MDYYADRLGDLISNDAILPAQFADSHRRALTPDEKLWWAVLSDALHWVALKEPMPHHQRTLYAQALTWIESRHRGIGTCEFVCGVLEIDPDALRSRVRAGKVARMPRHAHVADRGRMGRVMTVRNPQGYAVRAVRSGIVRKQSLQPA